MIINCTNISEYARTIDRNDAPLIVEEYPEDYKGLPFVSVIHYQDDSFLTVVDNIINNNIVAYVIDRNDVSSFPIRELVTISHEWYENNRTSHPLSIEFGKRDLIAQSSRYLYNFNLNFVTRVIGFVPIYNFSSTGKVRRRKCTIVTPTTKNS